MRRDPQRGSTNMRAEAKNKSDASSEPGVFLPSPGGPLFAVHGNGSLATVDPSQTAPPVDGGSGIIPGGIAAAVFISLLLALYAVLWKCMGTPPRKKEKRKVKIHEQREQLC
ncbi:uncharacterized protein sb:cb288 isoform X2 [Brienomyrus brachyistius]|uniref:uncharacterized protein sb:cb288 isoform X2 n=1 Tax=Brienomyrus brachyistius TaxID=42636 RepID=UPI0020B31EF9|nr:uncharacterized protein sb:cb288 isoform X2 [Brienomyrus brachyistius]